MNRIDRVTAILIQLQSRRVVKAQDVADRFNISLRTVYRDIKTLEEAGIPVIGEAGVGYSIMEGYRLPPVMFTKDEATALLTAEKLVEKLTDHSTRQMYEAAMFKIKSVLRLTERDHLENMEQHIEVVESPYFSKEKNETAYLQQILKAISDKLVVNIDYFAEHSQSKSNRNIEPVGIFYMGRFWYLIAWCTLRKDYRTFRVDHIKYLSITTIASDKTHPALKSFLSKVSKEKELHTIVILVDKEVIRYFGEQKFYNGFVSQKEVAGDKIEMTFLTESLPGFAKFYLLFGEHAEIVTPQKLVSVIRESIEKLSKRLSS